MQHEPQVLRRAAVTALGVWLAIAIVDTALSLAVSGSVVLWPLVALEFLHGCTWAAITVALFRFFPASATGRFNLAAWHLGALAIASVADAVVRRSAYMALVGPIAVPFFRTVLYYADATALSYIAAVFTGKVIAAREALIAHARHELALRSQLARARLQYLEAQLRPHFLFNALGTVSELIFEDPGAAVRIFRHLGALLRTAGLHRSSEVPLGEEIRSLAPYLEVQRIRFADWLGISVEIDDGAERYLVPSLILQPLVENSIRHGLRDRAARGEVVISARVAGDRLLITVRDNGVGLSRSNDVRDGVGLSNTRERLMMLYGEEASLRLFNDVSGGTVAEIVVPKRETQVVPVEAPPPPEAVVSVPGLARRHPILFLGACCILAALFWTQQSYAYLLIAGRLGERTFLSIVRNDVPSVVLWAAAVPVILAISRRVPFAGSRWRLPALVHVGSFVAISLAHSLLVIIVRQGSMSTFAATFSGSAAITLLVYAVAVAYAHRSLLEGWLAERHLASLRLAAEIEEAKLAAADISVSVEAVERSIEAVERHAAGNPLLAEQAVARLGSDLRAALDASAARGQSGGPVNQEGSLSASKVE